MGHARQQRALARTAAFSSAEWDAYERAKLAEQDARGALTVAHQEGLAEGHRSGLAQGKRDALLRLLAQKGLALTDEARARIAACTDIAMLGRWFDSALSAKTVADVFLDITPLHLAIEQVRLRGE